MLFSLPILWLAAHRVFHLLQSEINSTITRLLAVGALAEFRLVEESALYGRGLDEDPMIAVTGMHSTEAW